MNIEPGKHDQNTSGTNNAYDQPGHNGNFKSNRKILRSSKNLHSPIRPLAEGDADMAEIAPGRLLPDDNGGLIIGCGSIPLESGVTVGA